MTVSYVSAVFDKAILKAFTGNAAGTTFINWTTGQDTRIYCVLESSNLNGAPTNKAGYATYGDIGDEITNTTGSAYVAGGKAMTPTTVALSGASPNVANFVAAATSWTTASFSAKTAIVQWANVAATPAGTTVLLSYHDLTAGGGVQQTVTSGTLTLTWAASGVFTITISAAA